MNDRETSAPLRREGGRKRGDQMRCTQSSTKRSVANKGWWPAVRTRWWSPKYRWTRATVGCAFPRPRAHGSASRGSHAAGSSRAVLDRGQITAIGGERGTFAWCPCSGAAIIHRTNAQHAGSAHQAGHAREREPARGQHEASRQPSTVAQRLRCRKRRIGYKGRVIQRFESRIRRVTAWEATALVRLPLYLAFAPTALVRTHVRASQTSTRVAFTPKALRTRPRCAS